MQRERERERERERANARDTAGAHDVYKRRRSHVPIIFRPSFAHKHFLHTRIKPIRTIKETLKRAYTSRNRYRTTLFIFCTASVTRG